MCQERDELVTSKEDAAYSGSEIFEDDSRPQETRSRPRTEPSVKREAPRPRKEEQPEAEEAQEDDFREMLSGHRQKADPLVALDDLSARKGQAPGTATSSRIAPGERTEWTSERRGRDRSPNDEIDSLAPSVEYLLTFTQHLPNCSCAPRRSVAADLSRELFGDSNDEEPLPSHSSHLRDRNAGAWDAMTEMISWEKAVMGRRSSFGESMFFQKHRPENVRR
eukprot:s3357_g4.t1